MYNFNKEISLKNVELLYEKNRRKTFHTWVFSEDKKCNASKLAEAGFYFKEHPDVVQCFLCGKILDGWDEDDDPWSEHLSHASYCTFAKLQKAEKDMSVYQLHDISNELFMKVISDNLTEKEAGYVAQTKAKRKLIMEIKKSR